MKRATAAAVVDRLKHEELLREVRQILLAQSALLPSRAHLVALNDDAAKERRDYFARSTRLVAALMMQQGLTEVEVDTSLAAARHHLDFQVAHDSPIVTIRLSVFPSCAPAGVQ